MVLKKRTLVLRACIRCILSYWEERFGVCSYRGFIFKGQARVSRNFSGLIISVSTKNVTARVLS